MDCDDCDDCPHRPLVLPGRGSEGPTDVWRGLAVWRAGQDRTDWDVCKFNDENMLTVWSGLVSVISLIRIHWVALLRTNQQYQYQAVDTRALSGTFPWVRLLILSGLTCSAANLTCRSCRKNIRPNSLRFCWDIFVEMLPKLMHDLSVSRVCFILS